MEQPFGYLLLKTVGVLGLLIALIILLAFLLRKHSQKLLSRYASNRQIKIIERCPLSPKHTLVLVEIDGVRLIVGISPQNIVIKEKPSAEKIFASEDTEVSP